MNIELDDFGTCDNDEKQVGTSSHQVKLGLHSGITNDAYHSGSGISSSELKPALKSMHRYHEASIGNLPFKETEAMRLGTAVHKLTLEALDFSKEIVASKKFGRTASGKQEKREFHKANEGMTIIDHEDYDKCRRMRDSLMSLDEMKYIFEDGQPELSGYYQDHALPRNDSTYMLCKYRPDWRTDWCIFDVKTTRDVSEHAFSKQIHDLSYHLSAAHYLEGDRILKGTDHRQFLFGCVESEYPHEAAIYRLNDESLELGEWHRRKIIAKIKHGRNTKEWPKINDGMSMEIGVPGYALYEMREGKV